MATTEAAVENTPVRSGRSSTPSQDASVLDCYKVTAEKVLRVVERIIAKADPVRIVAFGSRARGEQRPNSDIDLAVIVRGYDFRRHYPPVQHGDLRLT